MTQMEQDFLNLSTEHEEAAKNEHIWALGSGDPDLASQHEQYAHIQIQDYGIGISQEDLPHIIDRFYRVNKARSRSDGGSGLGLSIVSQIIEQHQGKLMIESTLNQGTIVHIYIPIWEEDV